MITEFENCLLPKVLPVLLLSAILLPSALAQESSSGQEKSTLNKDDGQLPETWSLVPDSIPGLPLPPDRRASSVQKYSSLSLFVEQDFFVPLFNQDRNYTMGIALQVTGGLAYHSTYLLRRVDDGLSWAYEKSIGRTGSFRRYVPSIKRAHSSERAYINLSSLTLSGTAFTPDSLASVAPVAGDRPYAFLLAATAQRLTPVMGRTKAWKSELSLGLLGTRVGEELQTKIHTRMRKRSGKDEPVDPEGWTNQIADGGAPTFRYMVGREALIRNWTLGSLNLSGLRWVEPTWQWEAHLGYYTELDVGATVRLGAFQTAFWEWGAHPMSGMSRAGETEDLKPLEGFLFVGFRPRLVLYNALLQGWVIGDSEYTIRDSDEADLRHLNFEGEVGVQGTWRYCRCAGHSVTLSWVALAFRTAEFTGPEARTHTWGSVHLTLR